MPGRQVIRAARAFDGERVIADGVVITDDLLGRLARLGVTVCPTLGRLPMASRRRVYVN